MLSHFSMTMYNFLFIIRIVAIIFHVVAIVETHVCGKCLALYAVASAFR